jgi:glycosyltransferase involved in cell wall biosynthesis
MTLPVILVCGQNPMKGRSGHPSFTRAHAHAIMRAGGEPHIFCPGAPAAVTTTELGVVHCIGLSRLRRLTESQQLGLRKSFLGADAPRLAAAIVRFVHGEAGAGRRPHLIHSISAWGYAGVLAAEKLRAAGTEAVTINSVYTTIRHETDAKVRGLGATASLLDHAYFRGERLWQQRVVARYERRAYAGSRLVGVNYESVRRLFLAEYGAGAEIRRLPYGPESAFVHRDDGDALPPTPEPLAALTPATAPLIVSVSRHDPRKGMDVLLHALGELRRAGVAFRACLTSGGELLEANRELARRLDLGGTTALTGWVPDPFPYLRHADVFVLPSRQEGSGSLALLEALQAGTAIVASGIDGIVEDVTDGESALLVPPDDVAELTRALSRLVGDAALRRHLARRARRTFVERFSADAFSNGLRRMWSDVGFVR